jgi:hypothetical protein
MRLSLASESVRYTRALARRFGPLNGDMVVATSLQGNRPRERIARSAGGLLETANRMVHASTAVGDATTGCRARAHRAAVT